MNKEAILRVADCLSPMRFNVRDVNINLEEDFEPDLNPGAEYNVSIRYRITKHRVATSVDETDHVVRWYGQAGIKLQLHEVQEQVEENDDEEGGEEDFASESEKYDADIFIEFVETYILTDGKEIPNSDDLVEFGKHNVQYHVWPFLRELFQSYGERLGVGSIPLPHYTIKV